jgi:hypothetical protein
MLMRSIIYHLALLGTTSNNKENGGQIATTGIDEERPWDGVGCLTPVGGMEGWRDGGRDGRCGCARSHTLCALVCLWWALSPGEAQAVAWVDPGGRVTLGCSSQRERRTFPEEMPIPRSGRKIREPAVGVSTLYITRTDWSRSHGRLDRESIRPRPDGESVLLRTGKGDSITRVQPSAFSG